ncbi:voltage-gated chloride channel family protein [Mucilaginibacter kameinonensis]|uniref:voltage-gated chloride channel family protein n=1 Tax=Mucilaginibacter kameinonensis TaxID=452286 RepID=UPI000EF7B84D|nr:voltage-gated chloride channel family protein [Mucilaginibacter kameinonensis]
MQNQLFSSQHFAILKNALRWTVIIIPIAVVIGSAVALFLWLLSWAIHFRFAHNWLLYLLPLAGIAIFFIYKLFGGSAEKGNNLIIDEIHNPGGGVPKRMAPLVLITTFITHLFGGSAGREGTAVQMGGSLAQMIGKWLKLNDADTQTVLTAGIAAGFGAVFGTPLTGAVFAMEVLTIGRVQYNALLPCLIAGIVGDVTVAAWAVHHTPYHIDIIPLIPHWFSGYISTDLLLIMKTIVASIAFGLASYLFAKMVHGIKSFFTKYIKTPWLIPFIGGLIIIALTFINGKPDYLSLGVDAEHLGAITIPSAFHAGGADTWSWLWKTIYTTVTLGTGFKGGEVTPLFYIGATLGNTLSSVLDAPVSLFAALGFIAVFAGATNTPLACTFMGIELFGGEHALLFAVACFTAYLFSGHTGIYGSQRIGVTKLSDDPTDDKTLSDAMKKRSYLYQKLAKYSPLKGND